MHGDANGLNEEMFRQKAPSETGRELGCSILLTETADTMLCKAGRFLAETS